MVSEGEPPFRELRIARAAEARLGRLDRATVARIQARLDQVMAGDPAAGLALVVGSADPVRHRVRVGDLRLILHLDREAGVVSLLRIASRGQVYRRGG